jgi:GT2 family glycosyltransferase
VVIPSKNGSSLLEKQLPALLEQGPGEIIVVDDCSGDSTAELLTGAFPGVRLLRRTENPGFCHAVNLGMEAAASQMLLLLNNDVMPEPGCIRGMAELLEASPERTAVLVPRIRRPDGTDDGSVEWGFRRGLAFTAPGAGNPYPSGACALWRKSAWRRLEGLSSLYAPIYWEDADMGVRLALAGMDMGRYAGPGAEHRHAATMGTAADSMILRERNRFIFMDRWCRSRRMRASTILWLPLHMAASIARGGRSFVAGYREYRRWKHGH